MNVFLCPGKRNHIQLSVAEGLSRKKLDRFDIPEYFTDKFFAWGAKPTLRHTWETIRPDDFLLFYPTGQTQGEAVFTHIARVLEAKQDRKVADAVWGPDEDGNSWELMVLLRKPLEVDLPLKDFNRKAGYALGFRPQGFMRVRSENAETLVTWLAEVERGIVGPPPPDGGTMKEKLELIHNYIASKGFQFYPEVVRNFFVSLCTKPFVLLAGISGTGKSKLARLFSEAGGLGFALVPVKPQWNDPTDFVGYYNPMEHKFVEGEFMEVLRHAKSDPDRPFLLCLDEMNLAKVEHYFSDFVSLLETRRLEDGRVLTDPLKLGLPHGILRDEEAAQRIRDLEALASTLPENLFIVGTVNMDETTHPFSRRVLDRANTIEFSEIDLNPIPPFEGEAEPASLMLGDLAPRFLTLNDVFTKDPEYISDIVTRLQTINDILSKAYLHFAYRIRDEICIYMYIATRHFEVELIEDSRAFDFQIYQRILPRMQGSDELVFRALAELFNYCVDGQGIARIIDLEDSEDMITKHMSEAVDGSLYSRSARKIHFMAQRFYDTGFTSFWV